MDNVKFRLGIIGLGTMGRNLLFNMADHDFAVAGYDRDVEKVELLKQETEGRKVLGFSDITEFIASLEFPRVIILLVPAGKIVDAVLLELQPLLSKGDIIIDSGNSHFTDTMARVKALQLNGFHFFGMGISGGEEGARFGPSMMPGGDVDAYQYVKPVFEAIAAKVNNEPCVAYIGPGAAGHFVKMVHNGIEYALMQLIADTYELLKKGFGMDNQSIQSVFKKWNEGRLQSYLLEITADIFSFKNEDGTSLVDLIKDEAKSKGTGKWTTQVATDLEIPIPTIDMAVAMRNMSKYKLLRLKTAELYKVGGQEFDEDHRAMLLENLEDAYYFSMMLIYAQGMHLLSGASVVYDYGLRLNEIARIWRGGCIIRAAFLEMIRVAFEQNPSLIHLILDKEICSQVQKSAEGARNIVVAAAAKGLSIPAYAATLSYFDVLRTGQMSTNVIQAQRDYFGAHTYELIGQEGVFHTDWKGLLHNPQLKTES